VLSSLGVALGHEDPGVLCFQPIDVLLARCDKSQVRALFGPQELRASHRRSPLGK